MATAKFAHKRAKSPSMVDRQIKPLARLVPLSLRLVASSCSPSTDTINDIITPEWKNFVFFPLNGPPRSCMWNMARRKRRVRREIGKKSANIWVKLRWIYHWNSFLSKWKACKKCEAREKCASTISYTCPVDNTNSAFFVWPTWQL